jgi:hypothetical protein
MPPPVPIHALDYKGKSKLTGVSETRAGSFFAELSLKELKAIPESDYPEFGKTLYGPSRQRISEAKRDFDQLSLAAAEGSSSLRRALCKLAHLGGTKSHPNPKVVPVLAGAPKIHVKVGVTPSQEIKGVRRSNISASIAEGAPELMMERVLDIACDLLSCAADSQLGICPSTEDLVSAVKFALSREGVPCPLTSELIDEYVTPLIDAMKDYSPWASMSEIRTNTDDHDVIKGFLNQFLDKARQADQHGERKQLKRVKKEIRKRKKQAHTLFVANIPRNITEQDLFLLFNKGVEGIDNAIYRVEIPKDEAGAPRGFGFVICRSRRATLAILDCPRWQIGGRDLLVKLKNDRGREDESPKRRRISELVSQLPVPVEELIVKVVKQNPGCNVSQIPNLYVQVNEAEHDPLNPQQYGFRNLTHALQSIPTIYLELVKGGSTKRPAYFAYPK